LHLGKKAMMYYLKQTIGYTPFPGSKIMLNGRNYILRVCFF
jgi:hypothetical protein